MDFRRKKSSVCSTLCCRSIFGAKVGMPESLILRKHESPFNQLDLVSKLKFNLTANRGLKTVLNICKKRLFVKFFNPMISLVSARNAFGFSGRNQRDLTFGGYFSIVRSMNTNSHQRNP